jgi:hypothetical protein
VSGPEVDVVPPDPPGKVWRGKTARGRPCAIAAGAEGPKTPLVWIGPQDGDVWWPASDLSPEDVAAVFHAWALDLETDSARLRAILLAERRKLVACTHGRGWVCSSCAHFTRAWRAPRACEHCHLEGAYTGSYRRDQAAAYDDAAVAAMGDPPAAVLVTTLDGGRRLSDPAGVVHTIDDKGIAGASGVDGQWRSVEGPFFPCTLPAGWRWEP